MKIHRAPNKAILAYHRYLRRKSRGYVLVYGLFMSHASAYMKLTQYSTKR